MADYEKSSTGGTQERKQQAYTDPERQHDAQQETVEDDYSEPSNLVVGGQAIGKGARAVLGWIRSAFYKTLAFAGGAVKAFLFGDPSATNNFWDDLKSWVNARSYPGASQTTDPKQDQKEKETDKEEKNKQQDPEKADTKEPPQKNQETTPAKESPENETADYVPTEKEVTSIKNEMVDKDKVQQINRELIRHGFGCSQFSPNEFSLAAIDEKGNATSDICTVQAEAFHGPDGVNNPESLAAAIFRLKYANDPKVMESNESFDNAVIQSTVQAAIISAELSGNDKNVHHAEGVMRTTMGGLDYSVHANEDASYSVEIAGKAYTIPPLDTSSRDTPSSQERASELVSQFRQDPPQSSFTITEREGKEIRVDHELGSSKCFVQVIIDGNVKHEDLYDAKEAPKNYGKHDETKTLADLVQDIGRGSRSKVPEWNVRESEADKHSKWLSPTAIAYTIAGVVNPGMTPSISQDDPNKVFSLIHAGKRSGPEFINANTAHLAIDFSNGSPRYVANHGENGNVYTSINYNNPTETAQNIEDLRRVIIEKDPTENFPILSPNESKSPIDSIVDRMESVSRREDNQLTQSLALGQISIDCAEIIHSHDASTEINNSTDIESTATSEPAASIDIDEAIQGLSFTVEENDEAHIDEDGWTEGMDEETRAVYEQVVNEVEIG